MEVTLFWWGYALLPNTELKLYVTNKSNVITLSLFEVMKLSHFHSSDEWVIFCPNFFIKKFSFPENAQQKACVSLVLVKFWNSVLKLVRFYTRIGFKAVHEVTGSTMGDIAHMLVWGGVGTRMNANIEDLLIKWFTRFKSQKWFFQLLCLRNLTKANPKTMIKEWKRSVNCEAEANKWFICPKLHRAQGFLFLICSYISTNFVYKFTSLANFPFPCVNLTWFARLKCLRVNLLMNDSLSGCWAIHHNLSFTKKKEKPQFVQ